MKILLVSPDSGGYIAWFPLGLGYIASVCREHGHEVTIYNQDVYHYSEEHLTNFLDENKFDFVGLGSCGGYYQYHKAVAISEAINKSKHRPIYAIGGHLVSPEPEYFLKKTGADYIIIGEGEVTTVELLEALINKTDVSKVAGIAYLENSVCVKTAERELIKNIDTIPYPAWDLFPMDHYTLLRLPNISPNERCLPMFSGRGCTFKCNFCYRMDKGFRPRSAESIVAEIKLLKSKYNVKYIAFADELLMSSIERTITICETFIKEKLDIKWDCNGRLNYAKPEVLQLMKEAGCVFINYGIESMDDVALKNMNKALNTKIITEGIENTLASGISPGYNIIFGNIGETAESLQKGVDFLVKYDDHAQLRTIRPVTPYPGCPLYYHAIEQNLLKDCEDFYENKHTNSDLLAVNFTTLSDEEFYQALYAANSTLLKNYYKYNLDSMLDVARKLYLERDTSFRGFRQS